MIRKKPAIAAVALTILVFFGGVGQSANPKTDPLGRKTFTITGSTGLPGVMLQGLPGAPLTDENGVYAVEVESGWSGTVTPVKEGFTFSPPAKTYESVSVDLGNQDYRAAVIAYTISGNVNVAGVALQGLPGQPVSDPRGFYAVEVPYGWTGRVVPNKKGYEFEPSAREYVRVARSQTRQDYIARVFTYTISGSARLPGVTMEGLPGNPITDARGRYSAMVEYGWTGTVTPRKGDRHFAPASMHYTRVMTDHTSEDYEPKTVVISDRVVFGTEPIAGVIFTAEPGGYTATTDSQGYYQIEVPYGWNGTLSPSKPGFEFAPSSIPYSKVTTDINKAAPASPPELEPFPPDLSGVRSYRSSMAPVDDVLVIPSTDVSVDEFTETSEDIRVMQQILRDTLSEPRMILGVLYDYGDFLGAGGHRNDAFYLQGYGVLLVMEVDFPLSPAVPPEADPDQQQATPVDPVWQRARQKLYSPRDARYPSRAQPSPRDQMSFEQFKEDLTDTLRHAANIRHIDPNESIVLTIIGQSPGDRQAVSGQGRGAYSGRGGAWFEGGSYSYGSGAYSPAGGNSYADSRSYASGSVPGGGRRGRQSLTVSATTVLTIQAKKADIDAYARGEIDLSEFQQRVRTFAY